MLSNVDTRLQHPFGSDGARRGEQRFRHLVDRRQSIVVGLDFSGPSHRALSRAVDVAKNDGARLHILHAAPRMGTAMDGLVGNSRSLEIARDELERITARVGKDGLAARAHVFIGGVTRGLKNAADELAAALVVVGVRKPALPDTFLGTTAERVAAATQRPVLMVRRPVKRPYRHLIVAIEPTSDLNQLLAAARLVAPSAQRSIFHAYEDPYENGLLLDGASLANLQARRVEARREARARLLPVVTRAGVDPREVLLRGGSSRRVLELEDHEQRSNDTLFVLERERSRASQILFGTVCGWLIARGECDILLV